MLALPLIQCEAVILPASATNQLYAFLEAQAKQFDSTKYVYLINWIDTEIHQNLCSNKESLIKEEVAFLSRIRTEAASVIHQSDYNIEQVFLQFECSRNKLNLAVFRPQNYWSIVYVCAPSWWDYAIMSPIFLLVCETFFIGGTLFACQNAVKRRHSILTLLVVSGISVL